MSNPIPPVPIPDPARQAGTFVAKYTAVIIKNVVGWALMLSALVLGGFFPVPIGTPLFLIGFAMITLPGKRRLTSGALRGIPIKIYGRKAMMWRLAISLLLPPAMLWFLEFHRWPVVHPWQMSFWRFCVVYAVSIAAAWVVMLILLRAINALLSILPHVRRRVRPWMRDHGVNLLPPRKRKRFLGKSRPTDDEQILKIDLPPHLHRKTHVDKNA
jgi:hypothetical protein